MNQVPAPLTDKGMIPNFCLLPRVLLLIIIAELLAVLFTVLSHQIDQSIWNSLGLSSMFILWNSLFCAAIFCLYREQLNRLSVSRITILSSLLVFCSTLFTSLVALSWFYRVELTFNDAQLWFIGRNLLVAVMITLAWTRYLYLRLQVIEGLKAEGESRFRSLQAKIQPHFLFNTLNTIASLVTIDSDKAERTIENLSALMRSSLNPSDDVIALAQEISLCKAYLAIEQQRLGDKLRVVWQVDCDPTTVVLPPFTLQPLIENAVYHGIQRLNKGGEVLIEISQVKLQLSMSVTNPTPNNKAISGNQTAQSNIRQRLQIRYGEAANLTINQQANSYQALVVLPIELDNL
ncbi:MAG: histidine kinase [Kangiellaceae bacterium]|jgi:two-component system sensor histidine kinase AlgZ|nr:histidine kinase [Kangiellaceae bacterium]